MADRERDSEPPSSREGSADDDTGRASEPESSRRLLSRPTVWLGTLSTVVAIATGMFTLRDQIFPGDAGTAQASASVYQTSVGEICSDLNQTNGELVPNAATLATRLASAKTPLAQRDAVLDSWNFVLNSSQYDLGLFEGFDVPGGLLARERTTAAAWKRIVTRLGRFTRQLDSVSNDQALMAAVLTLPAMEQANAADVVTRTAGLTDLGDGRCVLDPPANVSTITLPQLPGASTVAVSVAPVEPMPGHDAGAAAVRPRHPQTHTKPAPVARSVVTPVVTPSVAPQSTSALPPPPTYSNRPPIHPAVAPVTPSVAPSGTSSGPSGGSGPSRAGGSSSSGSSSSRGGSPSGGG